MFRNTFFELFHNTFEMFENIFFKIVSEQMLRKTFEMFRNTFFKYFQTN